jgi:hypothetical protein
MAYTQADLDHLNAAIAGSELSVQFADGRRVQYRSIAELLQARRTVQAEIDRTAGDRPPRAFRITVGKGI